MLCFVALQHTTGRVKRFMLEVHKLINSQCSVVQSSEPRAKPRPTSEFAHTIQSVDPPPVPATRVPIMHDDT